MSMPLGRSFVVALASLIVAQAFGGSDPARAGSAGTTEPDGATAGTPSGQHEARHRDARDLPLPARPTDALGGRELLSELESASLDELEDRVVAEVRSGNVPASLRELEPVDLLVGGGARIWVTKDYLSVGSDDDSVRIPLRAATAERLARRLDATLPTKVMVDAILQRAQARLPPHAAAAEPHVLWRAQALQHDVAIDDLARRFDVGPGQLVAGHMKDVVISPALALHPGKVAIYGLHDLSDEPIQPLSVLHDDGYVDYSHGIRLVSERAEIAGEPVDLVEILADEERCRPVSPEGPIRIPAYDRQ